MLEEYSMQEQESGRTMTLIQAIEKIEKLEKQLDIAIKVLKHYENKKLCINALKEIKEVK